MVVKKSVENSEEKDIELQCHDCIFYLGNKNCGIKSFNKESYSYYRYEYLTSKCNLGCTAKETFDYSKYIKISDIFTPLSNNCDSSNTGDGNIHNKYRKSLICPSCQTNAIKLYNYEVQCDDNDIHKDIYLIFRCCKGHIFTLKFISCFGYYHNYKFEIYYEGNVVDILHYKYIIYRLKKLHIIDNTHRIDRSYKPICILWEKPYDNVDIPNILTYLKDILLVNGIPSLDCEIKRFGFYSKKDRVYSQFSPLDIEEIKKRKLGNYRGYFDEEKYYWNTSVMQVYYNIVKHYDTFIIINYKGCISKDMSKVLDYIKINTKKDEVKEIYNIFPQVNENYVR